MLILLCPKCNELTKKGDYKKWQTTIAICLFPFGLIALLAGRTSTICQNCNHTWEDKSSNHQHSTKRMKEEIHI